MILKLALAIINLYENNDYTKYDNLTLNIYFEICLRAIHPKTYFDIKNIDFILNLMPPDVQYNILERYYPRKSPMKTHGNYYVESNSYKIIRFHVNGYEKIPEFYSLLINKELFVKGLDSLKPIQMQKDKMIDRYIECDILACNNCNSPKRIEIEMLENVRAELQNNLVETLRKIRKKKV